MSVEQMRDILKNRTKYSGSINWRRKVNNMSDAQVMAVYFRLCSTQDGLRI